MKLRFLAVLLIVGLGLPAISAQEQSLLITVEELDALDKAGNAYIIDVRDLMSYLDGHIPGSSAVPLSEIPNKLENLREVEGTIIAYCACPAEETSLQAALLLSMNGFENVRVLKGGIRDWAESRPIVRGPRRY